MKLSIIICSHNSDFRQLCTCLDSVRCQSWVQDKKINKDYEIIIVDDYSDLNYYEILEDWYSVRLLENIFPKGLPSARNYGISQARGKIILFLDDDVELDRNYLAEIMKAFSFPFVMGTTGNLQTVRPQRPKIFESLMKYYAKIFNFSGFFANQDDIGTVHETGFVCANFDCVKPDVFLHRVQWLSGCNMAYRKEVFDNLKFDNEYIGHPYYEDADLSYRLYKQHPMGLWVVRTAKLKHFTVHDNLAKKKYWQLINCRRFFEKNVHDGSLKSLIHHHIAMASLFFPVLGYSVLSKNLNLIKEYIKSQYKILLSC